MTWGNDLMDAEANTADMENVDVVCSEFDSLTDEEIVLAIKDACDNTALDYLINKYRNFVRAKARSYFLIGADREDIIMQYRSLLHVAATRAKRALRVSWSGNATDLISAGR